MHAYGSFPSSGYIETSFKSRRELLKRGVSFHYDRGL